jgi:hypothetical protein
MIITRDGNVGIGTVTPIQKLDVMTAAGGTGLNIRTSSYGTNNQATHIRIGSGGAAANAHHAMITGGHTTLGRSYLAFSTISDYGSQGFNPVERMRISDEGKVGIGITNPANPLQISAGNSSVLTLGPNTSWGAKLNLGATGGGAAGSLNASIVVTNGNLHLDAAPGLWTYVNFYQGSNFVFSPSSTGVQSDDRVKTGEKFIENALTTLKKLKPQTYIQRRRLNDETSDCIYSSGLIAQEVYYQCPELRYIVKIPNTAHVDLTKEFPDDPQVDPDYSDWGEESATVGYMELIPYTISAINQLSNEGTRHKVRVSNISFSNVLEYHGLVVSKNSDVYVSNVENDKRVYGVISNVKAETNDSEVLVNYRGDGKIWVINTDNIQAGDYITTSNVPGYAKKQEGDTLRSYTIAKSSIDCDFTQPMIDEKRVVQTTIMTSRWKNQSNVLVSEATYSNLSDDVRYTDTKVVIAKLDTNEEISQEEYDLLQPESQNNYTQTTVTKYFYKKTRYLDYNPNDSGWIEESISKTVDSLDDNGQVIWENTGTQVSMYPIKYLTSDGTETDQTNAVYTAALIDCSILCG